jgi:hypothetical protein
MHARKLATLGAALAALAGLAVLVARAAPATAAPSTPTNVDVSALQNNDAEDAVAVNPTNPNNVVAMAITFTQQAGLIEGVSFNGGKTWTRQIIGGSTSDPLGDICCDEQLAWDRYGNLWMTYLLNSTGNVLVAVSTDGGLTWTKAADVVPITVPGNSQPKPKPHGSQHLAKYGDQPSIAVGPNSVWVSYTSVPSEEIQAFGASVSGLGIYGPFSPIERVPTSNGKGDYGDTSVGPTGELMVTYQDRTGGQVGADIFTAVDPDGLGAAGFDAPRLVTHTYVGGFDYIPAQPDRSVDAEANLAWDRSGGVHNGRVYLVWTQEVGNESNDMDIEVQYSDDSGATWSQAVRVHDDKTVNSQFMPSIALDQSTGNVALSWYDARNDLGTGGSGDTDGVPNDDVQIWGTYSTDGGASFVPNVRISAGTSNAVDAAYGFDYGDYTHAAFVAGSFWPVWSDNSNSAGGNPDGTLSKLDLYAAKVTVR